MNNLVNESPSFAARMADIIKSVKPSYENKAALNKAERMLKKALDQRMEEKTKTATDGGGVEASYATNESEIVDLSDDNDLKRRIGNISGSEKYKTI